MSKIVIEHLNRVEHKLERIDEKLDLLTERVAKGETHTKWEFRILGAIWAAIVWLGNKAIGG